MAGVQKAGTTALFSFLSKHPEIFLPARKEVHFFDNENLDWSRPSYDAFENIFASKTEAQIAGEVTLRLQAKIRKASQTGVNRLNLELSESRCKMQWRKTGRCGRD